MERLEIRSEKQINIWRIKPMISGDKKTHLKRILLFLKAFSGFGTEGKYLLLVVFFFTQSHTDMQIC